MKSRVCVQASENWRFFRPSGAVSNIHTVKLDYKLNPELDWAGGPGQSKDDMVWLDQRISNFFDENM